MQQIKIIETEDFFVEKRISKTPMPTMHHHRAFEIFYIINGEREYFIDDEFFKLETGDIIVVPSDLLHRTDGKAASRILVYFSYEHLKKFFTPEMIARLAIHRPFVFRPEGAQKDCLGLLFNTLLNEYSHVAKEGDPVNCPALSGYLQQILLMITYGNNTYIPREDIDGRIESVIKYINENYGSINNIEEIADHFYISKYHLCRLFARNLGVGLVTYLNTIKIRKACEMLRHDDVGITETAMRCGFNSSSYFCKVFRAEKGISPTEYRKNHRAAQYSE